MSSNAENKAALETDGSLEGPKQMCDASHATSTDATTASDRPSDGETLSSHSNVASTPGTDGTLPMETTIPKSKRARHEPRHDTGEVIDAKNTLRHHVPHSHTERLVPRHVSAAIMDAKHTRTRRSSNPCHDTGEVIDAKNTLQRQCATHPHTESDMPRHVSGAVMDAKHTRTGRSACPTVFPAPVPSHDDFYKQMHVIHPSPISESNDRADVVAVVTLSPLPSVANVDVSENDTPYHVAVALDNDPVFAVARVMEPALPNHESKTNTRCARRRWIQGAMLLVGLVATAATMVCLSGYCTPHPPSMEPAPRSHEIRAYIQSITLSGRTIAVVDAPTKDERQEEWALHWILNHDTLRWNLTDPTHLVRLQQRYALATLLARANNVSWGSIDNECDWWGVTCSERGASIVSELKLRGVHLNGTISADVGLLTSLVRLDVSHNGLGGSIPETLGLLTHLMEINLAFNGALAGSLPEHSSWEKLTTFVAAGNALTGSLPDVYGTWTSLLHFDVSSNLLQGTLPDAIGAWTNITYFSVRGNTMEGTLPDSLVQWSQMEHFDLSMTDQSKNWFNGTIPEFLDQWPLVYFNISWNSFSGSLPPSLGRWSNLQVFNVGSNFGLTGQIPDSYGQWTNLRYLDLRGNLLDGSLPNESFDMWSSLSYLDVSDNAFTGTIPQSMALLSRLEVLDLNFNLLSGSLPDFPDRVTYFDVNSNMLTGTLPESIGQRQNVTLFDASYNFLNGSLPNSIGQMQTVTFFYLEDNELTGSLPDSIGQWTDIACFSVAGNDLTGTLPQSMGHWTQVKTMYVDGNNFTKRDGSLELGVCNVSFPSECISDVLCTCCKCQATAVEDDVLGC